MNLCSICARGGSKGVKNKNLRLINGKPLIVYTIEHAKASELFDCIAVSSDSQEILDIAKKNGVDYCIKRPNEMATSTSAKLPAIQHCAKEVERLSGKYFDYFFDLDATSPLRKPIDINNAFDVLLKSSAGNLITASPARRSPYFNMVERAENARVRLAKSTDSQFVRRQDVPETFDMNASIYIWKREALFDSDRVISDSTTLYVMAEERSLDIDTELDFKIVSYILENALNE